ncbi:MAG: hypothetical protein H7A45_17195 [Verrucomicrobiales bacterium]|nr:hypothetical protein [Verrucomicrobiales bacterium]MCP5525613.1 hypothetical protein [Verrucomicrobiales bacterium]
MPTQLDVENQCFEFGDEWTIAFKYDDTDFYRREATKLQGVIHPIPHSTKAVDLIGVHRVSGMVLLEAKDFRGRRIANKPRLEGEVSVEVAVKARDTIAALIGAARKPIAEFPSGQLVDALKPGKDVLVVLWLEDDTFRDAAKAKATLGTLNQRLKSLLSWLNVRTFVLASSVPNRINHLTVTNLPGAGRPKP